MNPGVIGEINFVPRLLLKFATTPAQRDSRSFTIVRVKQKDLNTPIETKRNMFQTNVSLKQHTFIVRIELGLQTALGHDLPLLDEQVEWKEGSDDHTLVVHVFSSLSAYSICEALQSSSEE